MEGRQEDETTSRYFARQREQIEKAMKLSREVEQPPSKSSPKLAPPPPPPPPSRPAQEETDPRSSPSLSEEMALPDEGEVLEDISERGAVFQPEHADEDREVTDDHDYQPPLASAVPAAPRDPDPTPPPTRPTPPSGKPADAMRPTSPSGIHARPARERTPVAPDDTVVLPGEPLRTLSEYTGFLRALSAGSAIDELLEKHGMDYRQYASCMTAWGKLLQSRPDLALRMGQLLRG